MKMLKCSHILCKVNDIKKVVEHYTELGFTLQWGSKPEKSHNALIWFEEGPFIELFQLPKFAGPMSIPLTLAKGRAAGIRWKKWYNASEGWCDIALEPSEKDMEFNIEGIRSTLASTGIKSSKIIHGKRIPPDGQKVTYSFMATSPETLPFVVSAYNPPQRPKSIIHENGARGIAQVQLHISPEHRPLCGNLFDKDPWIKVHESDHPRISEVVLKGLKRTLDPKLLHGAALNPERIPS